eukprot:gene10454-11578_t
MLLVQTPTTLWTIDLLVDLPRTIEDDDINTNISVSDSVSDGNERREGWKVYKVKQMISEWEGGLPVEDFYLTCQGMTYHDMDDLPLTTTTSTSTHYNQDTSILFHLKFHGIKGGKGGFGAQLRSLAKQRGKKQTTNFGACRDLHGRRLRHINDEIILQKWKETQEQGQSFQSSQPTPSGIDLWFLATPSWADKMKKDGKKRFLTSKYKRDLCLDWLRARQGKVLPPDLPIHWGCPRGHKCEFAHGESDLQENARRAKEEEKAQQGRAAWEEEKEAYLRPIAAVMKEEDEVKNLVMMGLRAAKRAKTSTGSKAVSSASKGTGPAAAAPVANNNTSSQLISSSSTTPSSAPVSAPTPASTTTEKIFNLVSGQVVVEGHTEAVVLTGRASFSTITLSTEPLVVTPNTISSSWYYEVELLSDGLMQIGWARKEAFQALGEGDGVGDDGYSWAYDGYRQQRWHGGEGQSYGPQTGEIWHSGDVITCCLTISTPSSSSSSAEGSKNKKEVRMSFLHNGESLGDAFVFSVDVDEEDSETGGLEFYPAISLEEKETVGLLKESKAFQVPPPDTTYRPVYSTLA